MTLRRTGAVLLLLAALSIPATALGAHQFITLCYHDVRSTRAGIRPYDQVGIHQDALVAQLEWMREHGYNPVGVDDILAAHAGERTLPDHAVLLTFDDGLRSFHTRVLPLLELYGYPAVLSVVGSWLDVPPGQVVDYGGKPLMREDFVTWEELREIQASGLVEVASHSYDLHRGIQGNPQGNLQPAAVTREYIPLLRRYETDQEYRGRIREDLRRSAEQLEERIGFRPRVITWPYGEYSQVTEEIARELGMPVSLGLYSGVNTTGSVSGLHRILLGEDVDLSYFTVLLADPQARPPTRIAQVDLDYVYDPEPAQTERNLGQLLDRIQAMGITTVYLQAFADPDGDGTASALYYRNRHLPMRADLFNRVAWQLRTRTGVQVYGWLPVLAFELPDQTLNRKLRLEDGSGQGGAPKGEPRRLSPYEPEARAIIGDLYEDLAKASPLHGLLFHDDAYLRENEGPPNADLPPLARARRRTLTLCHLTDELAARTSRHRTPLRTARNLFARAVLEPESEVWLGQSLETFLHHYDQTAVMAMPYLEGAQRPEAWLHRLVDAVAEVPDRLDHVVFELQSVDWRRQRRVSPKELLSWMKLLQRRGAIHYGYYPDDFLANHPPLEELRRVISTSSYPYRRR